MTDFTTLDILNYYSGTMNEERREELELARAENPYVAGLFTGFLDQLHHAFDDHPELANEVDELLNEEELEGDWDDSLIYEESSVLCPTVPLLPSILLPVSCGFYDSDDEDVSAEVQLWWRVSKDNQACELSIPFEDNHEISFPYSVAMVRYRAKDGMLLSQRLMIIESNSSSQRFIGRLMIDDWLGSTFDVENCDPGDFEIVEVTDFNLEQVAIHHIEQVESAFQNSGLRCNVGISENLASLKSKIGVPS